ncbi:hypothetical protein ACFLUC_03540 [Chloroflexota bacterium]
MKDSKDLPDLRMLPTLDLVAHEDCDPRRVEKLCSRIHREGCLKNPPIVAEVPGSDRYVVLDGANRMMAFVSLGIPHIVAQLISYDYPGVAVDTWYHVVSGMRLEEFESALKKVAGMSLKDCSLQEARRSLENNESIAYIVCASGVRQVYSHDGDQPRNLQVLNDIVGAYKGRADIYRASNDIWEKQIPYYPDITALMIFPRYKPQDILHAAQNGYKVPSGVTRHIIPQRALNINIPLDVLNGDWSLKKKREWLDDWMMERMAANAIRYYAESTFSFNE